MATFVVHLYRLGNGVETDGGDLSKLSEQIRYYQDRLEKKIINFSIDDLVIEIKGFRSILEQTILPIAANADKYGNRYEPEYRYAEITYENLARIKSIRFLGVGGINSKRFIVENIQNPFSITALRLIQNIKEIVKTPSEVALEQLFQCKRDAWAKDSEILSGRTLPKYRYSWEYLTDNYFSPKPIYDLSGEMTDAEIYRLVKENNKKSVLKKQELEQRLQNIENNKNRIIEKAKKDKDKAKTPLEELEESLKKSGQKAGQIISNFLDKYSIGCLLQDALSCISPANVGCRDVFADLSPSQIFDRLAIVFPRGSDTFKELEKSVETQIFGSAIEEKKSELKAINIELESENFKLSELQKIRDAGGVDSNILSSIAETERKIETITKARQEKKIELDKELERVAQDLKMSQRQTQELKQQGGSLAVLFEPPQEGEQIGFASLTDKILAGIDAIIPLEDICEAIKSFLAGNGLPPFVFPQPPPVSDPFANFSLQINESFVAMLTQALVSFIQGILRDLVNCDNIDNFIAQAINSGRTGETFDPLKSLFGGNDIETIVSGNYDRFVANVSKKSNSIFTAGSGSNRVDIGLAEQDVENILRPDTEKRNILSDYTTAASRTILDVSQQTLSSGDFFSNELYEKAKQVESLWTINSKGDKFELTSGVRVFDVRELDKYVASLSQEGRRFLRQQDKSRNEVGSKVDENGIDLSSNFIEQPFSSVDSELPSGEIFIPRDRQQEITEELICILRHTTSILLPSQVLGLLAGNASQETISIANEIVSICSSEVRELFPTEQSVQRMFTTFGNVSGLSELQDETRLLINSPEFSRDFLPGKCGPYSSLEDFRQELLSRVMSREKARSILELVSEERVNRLNEVSDNLINFANSVPQALNQSSPNSVFVDAVKAALQDVEYQKQQTERARQEEKRTIEQRIKDQINSKFDNSPVIQSMLRITLDSLFFPLVEVFDRDMEGFIDSFSEVSQVEKPIERTISVDTARGKVTTINPEFKDLINNNFVPVLSSKDGSSTEDRYAKMVEKDSLKTLDILPKDAAGLPVVGDFLKGAGLTPALSILIDDEDRKIYISGEPSKNYLEKGLNGVPLRPVLKKENQKVVGDSFLRNIGNFDVFVDSTRDSLFISLDGKIDLVEAELIEQVISNLSSINPELIGNEENSISSIMSSNKPKWTIAYEQKKENNKIFEDILLNTEGSYYTPSNGVESFYLPRFRARQEQSLSGLSAGNLIKKYDTIEKTRKDVFDNIFFERLEPLLFTRQAVNLEKQFSQTSKETYAELLESFMSLFANGISNSSLMRESILKGQKVKLIELLDFTNECEHILDFECFRQEMSVLLTLLPEEEQTDRQLNGREARPSRLSKASTMLLSKMITKILCFDVIIKSLPAFDYFRFSKDITQSEIFTNLVCEFVVYELDRIKMKDFVFNNIRKYYKLRTENEITLDKCQQEQYTVITDEERQQFELNNFSYPIELKKVVEKQFISLLAKVKKIAKVDNSSVLETEEDFLKLVFDQYPVVDVHKSIGIDPELVNNLFIDTRKDDVFTRNNIGDNFVLQRYISLPLVNRESDVVKENPNYFTPSKIDELNSKSIMTFEEARDIFVDIYYSLGKDVRLFDCDENSKGLYAEPYSFGLRIVYADERQSNTPQYTINNQQYPFRLDLCQTLKAGFIREQNKSFNVIIIGDEKIKINRTESLAGFIQRNNVQRYSSEFLEDLKEKLQKNIDTNLFFTYGLALKEMSSVLLFHTNLVNNTLKMKYLFEPTKKRIEDVVKRLQSIGVRTTSSDRIRKILESQKRERQNVGNPAGPLDFDALKLYIRTPIQLLKGLTSVVDPNVAIADKIISGLSAAAAVTGNKIFLPYSLTSLALLPFPVFTPPPAGIIPPLTTYNLTTPLFLPFFILEPLLWDLPYYKTTRNEKLLGPVCED
jgi:hypothetical protein